MTISTLSAAGSTAPSDSGSGVCHYPTIEHSCMSAPRMTKIELIVPMQCVLRYVPFNADTFVNRWYN
jgi:hypothetical protein